MVFLIQMTFTLIGQNENAHEIIRLKNQLASAKDDTLRIRLLTSLASFYYYHEQSDSCMKYADKARGMANSLLMDDRTKHDSQYARRCNVLFAKALRFTGLAQDLSNTNAAMDSLQKALQIIKRTGDKEGIATIHQSLGWVYEYQSQTKQAMEHYLMAKSIYEETGNQKKLGYLMSLIGINQRYTGNYGDAIESQMQALKIGKEIKDTLTINEALLALGFTYLKVEKWSEALDYQKQALDLLIHMDDSTGIARVYSDMGVTHMSMDSLDAAIKDHKAALAIREKTNDHYSIASSYFYLGDIYQLQARYPEALEYYRQSYFFSNEGGYSINKMDSQLEIGSILHKMGENDLALKNYREVLEYSLDKEEWKGIVWASEAIGDVYLGEGKTGLAIKWLNKAVSKTPPNAFSILNPIHEKLADAYVLSGNYKMGYENFVLYHQTKDSLLVAENADKIITLTNRFEFESKQALLNDRHDKLMQLKQAEIEKQKLTRNFSLMGMGIILILAIIFFIRFVEKKKLNEKLQVTLSNLKATQGQLIQAEKMASLGELTAGVAHEIQNPLNFVNNFSEVSVDLTNDLVEEVNKGNTEEINILSLELKQNLEKITQHGKRASSIVNGMLDHSRKGSGQKEKTDINKIADEFLRLSYHGLKAKGKSFNADFKLDVDDNLQKINVIPQDIGRVLLNLINNAFYACAERSRSTANKNSGQNIEEFKPLVVVSTKKYEDKIEIRVKDNGTGIPQEIKDKIFQPFFTTKPTGEGTGLGLSLSYDIITKGHGGSLKVRTKEGEFTEFIINLPIN